MNSKPILFSGPMVRAILEGKKTQTRRVCRGIEEGLGGWPSFARGQNHGNMVKPKHCPYGTPSDHLWVRECWDSKIAHCGCCAQWCDCDSLKITYAADGTERFIGSDEWPDEATLPKRHVAMFMPRWASRLTLEITAVRVERVQDISHDDAWAEGTYEWLYGSGDLATHRANSGAASARAKELGKGFAWGAYANLWDSINGKKPGASWADNPWVWVVEFKRVEVAA